MDTRAIKPAVFVGSSTEGLEVARAVQVQLADVGEVELWNEGVFGLSYSTLESLVQALNSFDFAVLVLTPDDLTISRDAQQNSARDNVLIELGLFIGRLGRERTFLLVCDDTNIRIPSDLAGITFATFSRPADESKLISALGPACVKVRHTIKKLGQAIELRSLAETVKTQGEAVQNQKHQIQEQQEIINQLVLYSMSHLVFRHLSQLYHRSKTGEEYIFQGNLDAFKRDLRFLRDHGYLHHFHVEELRPGQNLVGSVTLTPAGTLFVELREKLERQRQIEST